MDLGLDGQRPQSGHARPGASAPTRRVLEVLAFVVARGGAPASLAEIVRGTGISRATAHAVVTQLVADRWLDRDAHGELLTGPVFGSVALSVATLVPLPRLARPHLEALAVETGYTTSLAMVRAGMADIVDSVDPPRRGRIPARQHGGLQAGISAPLRAPFGRDLIAWSTPETIRRWRRDWDTAEGATGSQSARLTTVLDAIRTRGYCIERSTVVPSGLLDVVSELDRAEIPSALRERLIGAVTEVTAIDLLPEELRPGTDHSVLSISAPVRDSTGSVLASLLLTPARRVRSEEIVRLGELVARRAGEIGTHCQAETPLTEPPTSMFPSDATTLREGSI